MKVFTRILLICLGFALLAAKQSKRAQPETIASKATATESYLFRREYHKGEQLKYHMKGINERWRYEIEANAVVKKDAAGKYFEQYAWSNLISNGAPVALSQSSTNFRQVLSLTPDYPPSIPDFRQVQPVLIGPITDLLTFYSDLLLASQQRILARAGDRFYFAHGGPNSWADGTYVLLGEDSIDFDFTVKEVNQSDHVATLLIRHVPPKEPKVKLPAEWMRTPVADTPNNWVEVAKKNDKYIAAVGKETFDVEMKVSLVDGKILSATIDNPVTTVERDCTDAVLASCGELRPHQIRRQIELVLER